MARISCPRCGSKQLKTTGRRTERWGCIRQFEELTCPRCHLNFEEEV